MRSGGLEDGKTYYVITSTSETNLDGDSRLVFGQSFQLAETENKARAGVAIAIDPSQATGNNHSFSALHVLDSGLTTGLGVRAGLEVTDKISTEAGFKGPGTSGNSPLEQYRDFVSTQFADRIFQAFSKDYQANANAGGSGAQQTLQVAAAFSFSQSDHRVLSIAGDLADGVNLIDGFSDADETAFETAFDSVEADNSPSSVVLKSKEDLEVTANITESIQLSAVSDVSPPKDTKDQKFSPPENAVSAAVIVGLNDNQAKAIVQADSDLDAYAATRVVSDVSYPFLTRPDEAIPGNVGELIDRLKTDGPQFVETYLDGSLGLASLLNTWARSNAQADNLSIAGSVNFLDFDNVSRAILKTGTQINQDPAFRSPNGNETVSVAATNYMQFLNMTGVFDFVLPSLSTSLLDLKIDANKGSYGLAGSSSKSGGFGGALFLKFLNNSTQGIVEEGVSIYSGDRGGFDMYVEEAILSFAFTQSGTSAGQYGIAGTFAFNQQDSDTLAYIGSGVNITGQSVSLYSGSRSTHINWAGSVATGSNLGFGATVSINDLNRNTGAIIGAIPADTGSSEAGEQPFGLPTGLNYTTPADLATSRTNIDVAGDISIDTLADGQNWAFSVAAAVVRDKATTAQVGDGSGVATDDALDGKSLPAAAGAGDNKAIANDQGQQGKFGIGISGDVSLNTLTENVYGFIFDAGVIHGNRFDIASMNETEVRSLSGGGGLCQQQEQHVRRLGGFL